MYSVHRLLNERQPDALGYLPNHLVQRDPEFFRIFQSEEEAERESLLLQENDKDGCRYYVVPA
jgi:hypothetical protein